MKRLLLAVTLASVLLGCKPFPKKPELPIKTVKAEFQIVQIRRGCDFAVMSVENKLIFENLSVRSVVNDARECGELMGAKFKSDILYYENAKATLAVDEAQIAILQIIMERRLNVADSTIDCTSKPVKNSASK